MRRLPNLIGVLVLQAGAAGAWCGHGEKINGRYYSYALTPSAESRTLAVKGKEYPCGPQQTIGSPFNSKGERVAGKISYLRQQCGPMLLWQETSYERCSRNDVLGLNIIGKVTDASLKRKRECLDNDKFYTTTDHKLRDNKGNEFQLEKKPPGSLHSIRRAGVLAGDRDERCSGNAKVETVRETFVFNRTTEPVVLQIKKTYPVTRGPSPFRRTP